MGPPSTNSWPHRAAKFGCYCGGWGVILIAAWVGWNSLREFYHPAFGFTRLLQISPSWGAKALPEVRDNPIYIYREEAGYDGQFYAQLALRPSLQDPALQTAIDIPSMRAPRILAPWVAALIGAGDGNRTLRVYAWLNVVCWIGLGFVLLRLFPPRSMANLIAWIGLMFSAGVTTSVVYALTDLPALLLLCIGMLFLARQRFKTTAGLFAAACLTRETSVLAGLALWQAPTWRQRILTGAIVVAPLALWVLYVRSVFPPNSDSLQNFALPLTAWAQELRESGAAVIASPADQLAWAGLAALIGLSVQAGWLVLRPQPRNPWWQLGIGYVVLLAILGPPTLAGFPSAVTRLLLPLHVAFNVLAPRTRPGLVLLVLGNLSIFVGAYMLSLGPIDTRELNHARHPSGPVMVQIGEGWNGVERNDLHTWSWSGGDSRLLIKRFTDDPSPAPVSINFTLVGEVGCDVTISQGEHVRWEGFTAKPGVTVLLPDIPLDHHGEAALDFHTDGPVRVEEGSGRRLAFAVYNVFFR